MSSSSSSSSSSSEMSGFALLESFETKKKYNDASTEYKASFFEYVIQHSKVYTSPFLMFKEIYPRWFTNNLYGISINILKKDFIKWSKKNPTKISKDLKKNIDNWNKKKEEDDEEDEEEEEEDEEEDEDDEEEYKEEEDEEEDEDEEPKSKRQKKDTIHDLVIQKHSLIIKQLEYILNLEKEFHNNLMSILDKH